MPLTALVNSDDIGTVRDRINSLISVYNNITEKTIHIFVGTQAALDAAFNGSGVGIGNYVGWHLCNGANGTDDLRDKFIMGYNEATQDINDTGGAASVTLTSAQSGLPAHTHTTEPHSHTVAVTGSTNADTGVTRTEIGNTTRTTSSETVVVNANTAANAAQAHENRPPFIVKAYFQKTP